MAVRYLLELAEEEIEPESVLSLEEELSHYLCRVLRMRAHQMFECFDGRGTAFSATLLQPDNRHAQICITARQPKVPAPTRQLAIGISLLKGQAMDRAIQQSTEMGATQIWIFASERSNAKLPAERSDNKMRHWRKIVVGAAEQCGRLHLPVCRSTILPELLAQPGEKMILQPQGIRIPVQLDDADRLLLVGPEGGWSNAELDLFQRNQCTTYTLGDTVMRAETVPAVALTVIQRAVGNF
ncbi:MAG: RsmE family RNA methyltransferase [Pseudomonadota bacterium]